MPPPDSATERTRLSWRRTSLVATVVAILLVRLALHQGTGVGVVGIAALCWVGLLVVIQRRVNTLSRTGREGPAGRESPADRENPAGRESPADRGSPADCGSPAGPESAAGRGSPAGPESPADSDSPAGRESAAGSESAAGRERRPAGRAVVLTAAACVAFGVLGVVLVVA